MQTLNAPQNRESAPSPGAAAISLEQVREAWCIALNVPDVADDDSFFILGGQSMTAVLMLAQLQEEHGVELALDSVFRHPVLRDFYDQLVQQDSPVPSVAAPDGAASQVFAEAGADARDEAAAAEPAVLSFQQLQVWTAYQLSGNPAPYNLPIVYRLTGEIDVDALRVALQRLSQQHSILRTTYGTVDGVPCQTQHPSLPIPFEVLDLTAASVPARERRLAEELSRLQAASIAIEHDAPLVVRLLRTGERDWHLLVCIHHIAFDGWSLKVFFEDLSSHYDAARDGAGGLCAPQPRVAYRRYALHSRRLADEGGYADALDYFTGYLAGLETLNALPTDSPRNPAGPGPAGGVVLHIDAARSARLAALAARHATTPFVVYLSALALVVSRQTHRPEAVIGVPTANRELADLRSTVGFFANTTPLRLAVPTGGTLQTLFKSSWDNVQQTFRHARLPFPLLVQQLAPARSSSCNPLFQIAFAFQNSTPPDKVLPGVEASYVQAPNRFAKFDLTVNVGFQPDGSAQIDWEYDTSLFLHDTMQRMAHRFDAALAWMERSGEPAAGSASSPSLALSQAPSPALSALPALAEEISLVQSLGRAPAPLDEADPLALLREVVAAQPDRPAVMQSQRTLTYTALARASDSLAAQLQDAGLRAGEPVAYAATRSLESIVTLLAVLKAGGVYLPMDTRYPPEQLRHMARDSGAVLFLAPPGVQAPEGMRGLVVDLPALLQTPARSPQPVQATPAAYLMYTSGTSGLPKGVLVPRAGIVRLVRDNGFLALDPQTVMLHAASPSFDAATFEIFGALLNGGLLVCDDQPHLDLRELLRLLRERSVTTMWLTAGLLPAFAELAREPLPALRHLLTGGDVVAPDAVARLHLLHPGLLVINGYGPTENTTFTACHRIERGFDASRPLPIGRPIAGTSVRVAAPDGSPLGVDQPGELWIGGLGLALQYHNAPERTAERFVERDGQRWYRTGDRVRLRANGVLDFLGRIDQEVKIRGYRIDLPTIEARLNAHPALAAGAIIVLGAGAADKRLVGLYVPREGHDVSATALQAWMAQTLPNYAVPSALQRIAALPTNANGKVDRAALTAQYEAASSPAPATGELDADQRTVAALWSDLLHTPARWGAEADFFEQGGNSLLVVQLAARLGDAAGHPIAVNTLYNHASLRAQARLLHAPAADARPVPGAGRIGPVVQLRLGDSGPAWIAIPGVGGLSHAFADIGNALRRQGARLYGFDSVGLRDGLASRGLAGAVRAWVEAIVRLQPQGPYALMGHSFGGRVAFEAALELERRGEQVTLLMIDAMPGNEVVNISEFDLPGHGPEGLAAWLLHAMGDTLGAADPLRRLQTLGLFSDLPIDAALGNVEWQLRANRTYRPSGRLQHGTVRLLRAAESDFGLASLEHVRSALAAHCAQSQVETLAGDHYTVLKRSAQDIARCAMDSLSATTAD